MSGTAGTPVGDDPAAEGHAPSGGDLRRSSAVAAPVAPSASAEDRPAKDNPAEDRAGEASTPSRPRPSPLRRQSDIETPHSATRKNDSSVLTFVDVGIGTRIRTFLLSPPALLTATMAVLAVLVNRHRLGLDLAGGRLLPLESLGQTWLSYLASWHPVGGGSAAPPPAALAVLGLLGLPVGSPAAAVSLLLLAALPLAALSAYRATRA
ncbi:MAG: glycosyltransferase, partial [Actinomycetota bacterium]|nr:glycosyltransferase [Actinomycetota bacterium]